jgi:hypothetical protein
MDNDSYNLWIMTRRPESSPANYSLIGESDTRAFTAQFQRIVTYKALNQIIKQLIPIAIATTHSCRVP